MSMLAVEMYSVVIVLRSADGWVEVSAFTTLALETNNSTVFSRCSGSRDEFS